MYCPIELQDGRYIGYQADPHTDTTRWYLCTLPEPPVATSRNRLSSEIIVISPTVVAIDESAIIDLGPSLAAILDAALDADGAIDDGGVIKPGVAPAGNPVIDS